MSVGLTAGGRRPLADRATHVLRVVRVVAGVEFKLKYSGSALGYVWSLVKPLGLFAMLYVVFGRFFKLNVGFAHYPLYLLVGLVFWTFFADSTTLAMYSLVARGNLLSRLSFPRVIIPLATSVTAAITLGVNMIAVGIFVAGNRIVPTFDWLLLIPLVLELFVVALGVGFFLAALFLRLRDVSQVWELVLQLLFYASPIIYPVQFLPPWSKPIAFLSPVVQVMQDARRVIIGGTQVITPTQVYGTRWGELIPVAFAVVIFVGGLGFFRWQQPWFAERL